MTIGKGILLDILKQLQERLLNAFNTKDWCIGMLITLILIIKYAPEYHAIPHNHADESFVETLKACKNALLLRDDTTDPGVARRVKPALGLVTVREPSTVCPLLQPGQAHFSGSPGHCWLLCRFRQGKSPAILTWVGAKRLFSPRMQMILSA